MAANDSDRNVIRQYTPSNTNSLAEDGASGSSCLEPGDLCVSKPRLGNCKFFNTDLKGKGWKELKRNETGLSLRCIFGVQGQ